MGYIADHMNTVLFRTANLPLLVATMTSFNRADSGFLDSLSYDDLAPILVESATGAAPELVISSVKDSELGPKLVSDVEETPSSRTSIHTRANNDTSPLTDHLDVKARDDHDRNETPGATELTDQTNLLPFRKVVSVFLGLAVCIVGSTLDQTIVATSLPSISSHFHAGTCPKVECSCDSSNE